MKIFGGNSCLSEKGSLRQKKLFLKIAKLIIFFLKCFVFFDFIINSCLKDISFSIHFLPDFEDYSNQKAILIKSFFKGNQRSFESSGIPTRLKKGMKIPLKLKLFVIFLFSFNYPVFG